MAARKGVPSKEGKKGKKKSGGKKQDPGRMVAGVVVILILVVGGYFLFKPSSESVRYPTQSVDVFATCLTDAGAVMYGAFWCPHCTRTKQNFGSSFKNIIYVECDPNGEDEQSALCIEKEIEAYDTWEFKDGSRVVGEPSFETLSEKTGCSLPVA
jgi:hypothetical protein